MSDWIGRVIGVLLIVAAVAFALSRAPDRSVESLVARWAPPPSDFIDLRGLVVHLRDEGPRDDPAPVVLLHGTSSSLHTWEGWARALKTGRRVITLDLPGFGLTGPFTGDWPAEDYRGDTLARFVITLLDRLQVQRFVVGGNSLGGEIAWRMATLQPQRVAGLILVAASGPAHEAQAVPAGLWLARVPVLNRVGEHLLPRSLVATSVASVYGDPGKVTAALVDRYFELTLREGNRRALTQRLAARVAGQDEERIATLKLPTLILWGGRDRLIPPAVGKVFESRVHGSRRVVFDDLGHVPQEEDPARTVEPVREFLARL
jgi:pimeloyl-ACP methyl ester carboxylesterase